MTVSLDGLTSLSTIQQNGFKTAVATTAMVGVEHVLITSVTLASQIEVGFEVVSLNYSTASALGLQLRKGLFRENLNASGLSLGVTVSGPSFKNHDYAMLFCSDCPEGQCLCQPGFFRANWECVECPIHTFKTNVSDDACTSCPPGTFQDETGMTICEDCPAGKYHNELHAENDFGLCVECPPDTFSAPRSRNVRECLCNAGFAASDGIASDGIDPAWTCTACPAGYFGTTPNATGCSSCGSGTYSIATAATTSEVCTECPDGQFNVDTGQSQCTSCTPGTWQNTTAGSAKSSPCLSCPSFSDHNVTGSITIDDCVCTAGLYKELGDVCEPCPEIFFCSDNVQWQCPENTDTRGLQQSTDVTACKCSAGFYGPNGGPCQICPVGKFCPGGLHHHPCQPHSNSSEGSTSQEDCSCVPGYFLEESCVKCPPNNFCPGGVAKHACSVHSFSPAGSTAISRCWCEQGMWRGCILTAAGDSVDGSGNPCDIDYTLDCFACGADVVCQNNTLSHCPSNSAAPVGSHDPAACVCVEGFHAVDGNNHSLGDA